MAPPLSAKKLQKVNLKNFEENKNRNRTKQCRDLGVWGPQAHGLVKRSLCDDECQTLWLFLTVFRLLFCSSLPLIGFSEAFLGKPWCLRPAVFKATLWTGWGIIMWRWMFDFVAFLTVLGLLLWKHGLPHTSRHRMCYWGLYVDLGVWGPFLFEIFKIFSLKKVFVFLSLSTVLAVFRLLFWSSSPLIGSLEALLGGAMDKPWCLRSPVFETISWACWGTIMWWLL